MRRAVLLMILCGCSSAGNPGDSSYAPKPAVIYGGDQSTGRLEAEAPRASSANIAAAPTAVWAAAKQVFASLQITVAVENAAAHVIGNQNFYKSRQLAGEPMTTFVDCGSGMTGPKAASYRIYMSLVADISGDSQSSTAKVTFTALGQDVSQGSTDRIPCGSTGRLEQLFLDRLKAAVALR